MMIYVEPVFLATMTGVRRFSRLLFTLSFCVLLIGCDSHSASSDADTNDSVLVTTTNVLTRDKNARENTLVVESKNTSDNPTDLDGDSGESLMSAAKPADKARTRRAPMFSESNDDGMLQATLIGDYVGMLPCSFCGSVALTLNLFTDGSVLKTSIYENPESPTAPLVESGIYRQDSDTITIVYTDKSIESYDIQDNHLVMLNTDKTPDADYTLSRQ